MRRTDDFMVLQFVTKDTEEFELDLGDQVITIEPHDHQMEPSADIGDHGQWTCTECPYSYLDDFSVT